MPTWLSLGFQDAASPGMSELLVLHDHVMTVMFSVIILISYILFYMNFNSKYYKFFSEGTLIETVWSVVPAFLLMVLIIPSMKVLYMVEDIKHPSFTFKVVAHQWWWSYAFFFPGNYGLSSSISSNFLVNSQIESSMVMQEPYTLSVNSYLILPVGVFSRLLISSIDVIHSFAVPSLGLKVDALPGRINQIFVNPSRVGLFYGQCSEICGSNHSFMPIGVKVCSMTDFYNLSFSNLGEFMLD